MDQKIITPNSAYRMLHTYRATINEEFHKFAKLEIMGCFILGHSMNDDEMHQFLKVVDPARAAWLREFWWLNSKRRGDRLMMPVKGNGLDVFLDVAAGVVPPNLKLIRIDSDEEQNNHYFRDERKRENERSAKQD